MLAAAREITISKRAVWRGTMALSRAKGLLIAIRDEIPRFDFLSTDIEEIGTALDALIDAYPEDGPSTAQGDRNGDAVRK